MSIDLIVVNYKTYNLIDDFLNSYRTFKPKTDSQVILVDNSSDVKQLSQLDVSDTVVFSFEDNLGYAGACNYGAKYSDSEYVAFFNSDTRFVDDKCVDRCVEYMDQNPDVAIVGPLQYSGDGIVTHGGILGTHDNPKSRGWKSKHINKFRDIQEAVMVAGSAFFFRRSVWNEMQECPIYKESFPFAEGAFPPFPHFYEETLFCYHVSAHGYKCVYLGDAEMIHEWHKSSPVGSQNENFKIGRKMFREFCDKHEIPRD